MRSGNLGGHFQRVEAHDCHDGHLGLDELAKVHQTLLDVAVKGRPDLGVAKLPAGELHRRLGGLNAGAQISRALQRGIVTGLLRLHGGFRVVERLLRDQCVAEEFVGARVCLIRLNEIRFCLLDVRGLLDLGQVLRIRRAVLSERPRERGLLLLIRILLLLVIDLDQDLSRFDAISEIGKDGADCAIGLGRNCDLIHGGQRPDDVHRSADGVLDDRGGRDRFGHAIAGLGVGRLRLAATGRSHCQEDRRDSR